MFPYTPGLLALAQPDPQLVSPISHQMRLFKVTRGPPLSPWGTQQEQKFRPQPAHTTTHSVGSGWASPWESRVGVRASCLPGEGQGLCRWRVFVCTRQELLNQLLTIF